MPSKENDPIIAQAMESEHVDGMSTVVYVIYKQGFFGQGIHGICTDSIAVEKLAQQAAHRDVDEYHSYDIYKVPLGMLPELSNNRMADFGFMNSEPVVSINRKGITVSKKSTTSLSPIEQQNEDCKFAIVVGTEDNYKIIRWWWGNQTLEDINADPAQKKVLKSVYNDTVDKFGQKAVLNPNEQLRSLGLI